MDLRGLAEALNGVYFVAFVIGLGLGAAVTVGRLIRYWRNHEDPPALLWRDVVTRLTLALPFAGILLIRFFGLRPLDEWWGPWWLIISGALAVIGVWHYLYYEVFVIERE